MTQRPQQKSMWEQRSHPKYLLVFVKKMGFDLIDLIIYQVLGNKYQSKLLEIIDERWVHHNIYCNIVVSDFSCVTSNFNPSPYLPCVRSNFNFQSFFCSTIVILCVQKLLSFISIESRFLTIFISIGFALPVNCPSFWEASVLVLIKEAACALIRALGRMQI